ncbi:MAG: hypothetical protein CSA66_04415 [Proteobacteria bacterium]|nr:MAG: hypothetical protein CSA66_04415 [Pseudomonadota bacterium]
MGSTSCREYTRLAGWADAERGLRLLFRALVVECVVLGGAVLLVVVGFIVDSRGLVSWVTGAGSVAVLLMLGFALARYRRVAPETGARGPATAAFGAAMVTLALFVAGAALGLEGPAETALHLVFAMAEPGILPVASTAALLITLALQLQSMRRLARFLERGDVLAMSGTTRGALVTVAVVFGILQMALSNGGSDARAWGALIGLTYLGVIIWLLVYYLLTVHTLLCAFGQQVAVARAFD